MATADSIRQLKTMLGAAADGMTDLQLSERIDANDGNVPLTASVIWRTKAADYSTLVDVTEGSSTRKLGSLYKNAIAMADMYAAMAVDDESPGKTRGTRTRAIERA